ncbi:MAG: hypothetical protein QNK19_17215 [Xanthomonadales bacterium]|nr:hypothetical protein [Xanthomonadales bacterium]
MSAAIAYDELISGDLPDLNAVTPVLGVKDGNNEVLGELGVDPDTTDSFIVDLCNGLRLDSIVVTKFPVPANGYQLGFNLYYADSLRHISIEQVHLGVDILPLLNPLWGPGFSLPIENDFIEISLLQTLSRNEYGFDFVVSPASLPPLPQDSDSDGIPDTCDNCLLRANEDQRDTDSDRYGNMCDGDLNNDGSTNTLDLNLYKPAHNSSLGEANYNVDADFNGDDAINTLDLNIYKGLHNRLPGPSCCAP